MNKFLFWILFFIIFLFYNSTEEYPIYGRVKSTNVVETIEAIKNVLLEHNITIVPKFDVVVNCFCCFGIKYI